MDVMKGKHDVTISEHATKDIETALGEFKTLADHPNNQHDPTIMWYRALIHSLYKLSNIDISKIIKNHSVNIKDIGEACFETYKINEKYIISINEFSFFNPPSKIYGSKIQHLNPNSIYKEYTIKAERAFRGKNDGNFEKGRENNTIGAVIVKYKKKNYLYNFINKKTGRVIFPNDWFTNAEFLFKNEKYWAVVIKREDNQEYYIEKKTNKFIPVPKNESFFTKHLDYVPLFEEFCMMLDE